MFLSTQSKSTLLSNSYALEREMLRVEDFKNSTTPHPAVFGLKEENPYITVDFAENQLEVVTPQFSTISDMVKFNEALYDITASELSDNEILWPLSMPCDLSTNIFPAKFKNEKDNQNYREYLAEKYDVRKQFISGIHFNFSFSDHFINNLYEQFSNEYSYQEFKNNMYLKIVNNYRYYKYLITVFLGASPVAHESFGPTNDVYAIRSSSHGYCNTEKLDIDYTSVENFISSVDHAMSEKKIIDEREIYDSIRVKNGTKFVSRTLKETGIKYIEIRNIDINPYFKGGIDTDSVRFIELILLYSLFSDIREDCCMNCPVGNSTDIYEFSDKILSDMNLLMEFSNENNLELEDLLYKFLSDFNSKNLLTFRVKNDIENGSFEEFGTKLANTYKNDAYNNRYKFSGYENMELSTQLLIREAVKRGITVEVIDKYDNFISLSKNDKNELVKQCTQTSKDSFVSVLAMENKVVTKKILQKHNMVVPNGGEFTDVESAASFALMYEKDFVVKPKSTNFGLGISIFRDNIIKDDVISAIELAFSHDNTVLIEEFITGEEYRFLVIDDKVVGILNRVPANVIGDGVSTIEELVSEKNKDSLRGIGYVSPLEKINIDEAAQLFLHAQNLTKDSVIEEGTQVFLRENSNISTGGDSIDYTDEVDDFFKQIAIDATRTVDVTFCGVDIMIEDIKDSSSKYGIIELNFNPAIHIHSHPYKGVERNIALEVLKALELV